MLARRRVCRGTDHFERALSLSNPTAKTSLATLRTRRRPRSNGVPRDHDVATGRTSTARELIDEANRRARDLGHVQSMAIRSTGNRRFEMMRGEAAAALNASEVARLAREHDMPDWRGKGDWIPRAATAERGALGEGLSTGAGAQSCSGSRSAFRRALKIALAGAEARAGDADRALAVLDEGLATSDRTGFRAFDAEPHRARGEILLKRDPANPAPAEEALRAAIAVAKQARHAQLRTARRAVARQALPIDRPPRRRARRPRAGARRLLADARNAGDRRGAGAAGGAGGDGRGQGRRCAATSAGSICKRPTATR